MGSVSPDTTLELLRFLQRLRLLALEQTFLSRSGDVAGHKLGPSKQALCFLTPGFPRELCKLTAMTACVQVRASNTVSDASGNFLPRPFSFSSANN